MKKLGHKAQVYKYYRIIHGNALLPSPDIAKTSTISPGIYVILHDDQNGYFLYPKEVNFETILDLPGMPTQQIINSLDLFWKPETKAKYADMGLSYKRGILLHGQPGCHAKGTKILLHNGTTKNVEDVIVGDMLMGPDSEPREVLQLARNRQEMVKIIPTKGDPFVVNRDHILHLTPSSMSIHTPMNIKFSDWLNESKCFQDRFKLTRTGVEFKEQKLKIPPYILGAWLGDGHSRTSTITSMDAPIIQEWMDYGKSLNLEIRIEDIPNNQSKNYHIHQKNGGNRYIQTQNKFLYNLKNMNLIQNKHIPQEYLNSSTKQRLELLAGIIDTDGSLSDNGFDYISKLEVLADNVVFLTRSLGLAAYKSECQKSCIYKGEKIEGTYYRVSISGDCSIVPVKLERKMPEKRKQIKNVLRTGFTYELLSEDDYYGFSLNRDHLYLTEDFTIHHNTGKTLSVIKVCEKFISKGGIVIFNPQAAALSDIITKIRDIQPDLKIMIVWEEFDEWKDDTTLLSLLDGELQTDSIVYIATTNFLDKIPARIQNRPSRFAEKIEVKFPTLEDRKIYLTSKMKSLDKKTINNIAQNTKGLVIDQVKDIVISTQIFGLSLREAIAKVRTYNLFEEDKVDPTAEANDLEENILRAKQNQDFINYYSKGMAQKARGHRR